jgi:hypothetical protein
VAEVTVEETPVAVLVAVTFAPGITPPVGSVTVPRILPYTLSARPVFAMNKHNKQQPLAQTAIFVIKGLRITSSLD